MAFYVGSVNYFPGIIPPPSANSAGAMLINDGTSGYWAYPGAPQAAAGSGLQYRSIFTHGYLAAGYKDANMWRSVNKTWHSTDITVYCGEQIDKPGAYVGGTFSDFYGYVHGTTDGSFAAASTHTSSYNLHTGLMRTVQTQSWGTQPSVAFGFTGNNPNSVAGFPYGDASGNASGTATGASGTGTWELSVARSYLGGLVDQINQVGYIAGGSQSSVTDKFHMPTEVMYQTTSHNGTVGSHVTGAGGSTIGWWSFAGATRSLTFSNDSYATWTPGGGVSASPDGVCKILPTKLGHHYVGTGTNVTTGFGKFSDSTGSWINSGLTKPTAYGEENFEMGQNWGYMLGQYNGLQNNYSTKHNYSTDAITVMTTATHPKGHVGASSGHCSSAAALITASNM